MTTVKIRIDYNQAHNIAVHQFNRARNGEKNVVVSDACVVRELLLVAAERKVKIEFYTIDEKFKRHALDLDGVKRVLEGEKVKPEQRRLL